MVLRFSRNSTRPVGLRTLPVRAPCGLNQGKLRKLGDSPRPCCLQVAGILLSSKMAPFLKDFGGKYSDLLYQNG